MLQEEFELDAEITSSVTYFMVCVHIAGGSASGGLHPLQRSRELCFSDTNCPVNYAANGAASYKSLVQN